MKAECPFDSIVFCSLIQWTRLESKTTTMEPKSRQEGMLNSPVLSLWLPWSYFSRLLRSCIGTVGLFFLPRPHRQLQGPTRSRCNSGSKFKVKVFMYDLA